MHTSNTRVTSGLMRKYIVIFLLVKVIPLILLALLARRQFIVLGEVLRGIAVADSTKSLNDGAVENIERLTTDTAHRVAEFLYGRDADILHVAGMEPTEENYRAFLTHARRRVIQPGEWELSEDGTSWQPVTPRPSVAAAVSTNPENDDKDGFRYTPPTPFRYAAVPLYDEITFFDLEGREVVKVVAEDTPKKRYPPSPELRDITRRENTYIGAERYFQEAKRLAPGEIHVSDLIGAYTGTNHIGIYTPVEVRKASEARGYPIPYAPEQQAYAGQENPHGRRFEGIVRWVAPVTDVAGKVKGYATLALNHDHIMEFVDHITPMNERYTELPMAAEGNYAFIWDYRCRNICHPRHHSIVGFDPETGDPAVPWLESSLYEGWQKSGVKKWDEYLRGYPPFHEQSRTKRPARELTRAGLVGLDGRYLNNAPQCTGWMDLTRDGGSGSFYILWSGVYKLTTAAAIPYYTGPYAPSAANGFSKRGFGFVAIGAGLDDFTRPATATAEKLDASIRENLRETVTRLALTTLAVTLAVILLAVWMAWRISRPITRMAGHMSRLAIGDITGDDIPRTDQNRGDEIGLLARSLQTLTMARRDELAMAKAIAGGDYTRSIALRSDQDLLGKAFNGMVHINKQALLQVSSAVDEVGMGAASVSDVAVSLSQGVQTSETVLRSISANVETVDRQAQDNAATAQGANRLANASSDAAHRGYESVVQLVASMSQIRQEGGKIVSVIKLIDDIAFQTNLLALNAAVEASRAGRHGKGFSVVADEVRSLSARSAKAAHDTGDLVRSMLQLMDTGAQLAQHSDREFQEIVDSTAQVARLFDSITEASNAQSRAMSQIVHSLAQIEQVILDNSMNARQMSSSSATLSRQAEELQSMLSHFRLESGRESRD